MSKIGRQPVTIKEGASVTIEGNTVTVNGPRGTLFYDVPSSLLVKIEQGQVMVSLKEVHQEKKERSAKNSNALYGTARSIIANMVLGVSNGFEKKLELTGVGYRAQVTGSDLVLSVGFSHPVKVVAPSGISFKVAENVISVSGIDKSLVGDFAAKIRSIRPPEPYKGKGISYMGERIRRKAGKAAKAVGVK